MVQTLIKTPNQILIFWYCSNISRSFFSDHNDKWISLFIWKNAGANSEMVQTLIRHTPTQILTSGVDQISAGRYHSLILKNDGSLCSYGNNNYGQLGDGTTTDKHLPIQIFLPAPPHGGTQVVGTTNRNDIFNGLPYGQRQVNVALLDQSGNLHNPPITQSISVNYQSTTGGYQTPTGNYQSPTGNTNQPSSPSDQNNNTPIPILSASDGRVLIDQLNGKFRYRDLKNITVWTVSQN